MAYCPDPVFTPALKLRFLDELSNHGNVRVAAARVGVSRSGAYLARRRDSSFAAAWRSALCLARDHAEVVLAERALDGVEEPVFYRGEVIAVRRRFDTRLLLAHLARLDGLCAADEGAAFDRRLAVVAGLAEEDLPAQTRAEHLAAVEAEAGERFERATPLPDPLDPWDYDPADAEPYYENEAIRAAEEEEAALEEACEAAEARYAAARAEAVAGEVARAAAEWDAAAERLHAAVDAVRLGAFGQTQDEAPFEVKSLGGIGSRKGAKARRSPVCGEAALPCWSGGMVERFESLRRPDPAQPPCAFAPLREPKCAVAPPPQAPPCTLSIVSTRCPEVVRRAGRAVRRRGRFLVGLCVSLVDGKWSGGERAARQGQPIG